MRAERKAGQLLKQMDKAKGAKGNPGGQGAKIVRSPEGTTLKDHGITKKQSSKWQKLGDVPDDDGLSFGHYLKRSPPTMGRYNWPKKFCRSTGRQHRASMNGTTYESPFR